MHMEESCVTITVLGQAVTLDTSKLAFSEITLSSYIETEGGLYDYFGARLADAEYEMWLKEVAHDTMYSERFKEHKDHGASDKLAEANAKADDDVVAAKKEVLEAKYRVRLLQQHLRAFDKNHENAQSRGHFLRKEMDKLHGDIYRRPNGVVKEIDPETLEEVER